jgi:hypothetical protein
VTEDPGDDLADRVTALEQQQRADRRALGSLDRDVSDLQQQRRQDVRLLQSIRDTQIEHGRRLDGLDRRFDGLETRFDGLEGRVESGFADMRTSLSLILELLRRNAS